MSKPTEMRILLVPVLMFVMAAGCQLFGFDPWGDSTQHRERWARQHDGDYSYQLHRGCFCFPAGQFRVQVVDLKVVDVYDLTRDMPLDPQAYEHVETIEEIFDVIDEAREGNPDEFSVEYARTGYPKSVSIDWFINAADDELYLAVSDVKIGIAEPD